MSLVLWYDSEQPESLLHFVLFFFPIFAPTPFTFQFDKVHL